VVVEEAAAIPGAKRIDHRQQPRRRFFRRLDGQAVLMDPHDRSAATLLAEIAARTAR